MTETLVRQDGVVAPQKRGIVPAKYPDKIAEAIAARDAAQLALEQIVAEALKAGGSIREVSAASGLADATVQRYGRAHGWPTAAQKQEREDAKERRARINRIMRGEE